jgi:hypothetical protein
VRDEWVSPRQEPRLYIFTREAMNSRMIDYIANTEKALVETFIENTW